ncbi:MAG: exopolyphosphatase / guanosine-5-triphosphate,3-diphosphate pyrophosphatase [Thermoleophilales bacterium]|nr:exopolyphosphatase / guanosine-5-triphosphate,3-diphosphate pyrophosphatase [Thermoleophilales bacterium]
MRPVRRTAVIDMGSNSFRLVVYGWEPGRCWQHVDEIREAVRVSAGMSESGAIKKSRVKRAVQTAVVFASFCDHAGIDEVIPVATSAIRDASNRDELLAEMRERAGLDVRVLSTEDETRYGYLAIANTTTMVDGWGIDLGGGSVQLMRIEDRRLRESGSWPLGAVRATEDFLGENGANGKALKALRKHVAKVVGECDWLPDGDGGAFAGIGGTIRNLASAAQKRAGHPDTGGVQGFRLTRDALEELIEELAEMPPSKRGSVPGIKPDRGDVILGGAAVLAAIMEAARFEEVEVTEAGLREGIFFERFLEGRDPPLFDDVRSAAVDNLARRYQDDLTHPQHVLDLSLELFDGLRMNGLADAVNGSERELLSAASMLHDIGTAVDYDDHHKHSRYLILHAGLPGFSPRELELIALIARYHRKGEPDASELGPLARKKDDERLLLLSAIIRLAEQLERSRDQAIKSVGVQRSNGTVTLAPETRGESAPVAIWSARRNADLLERAIGKKVEVAGPDE